MSRLTEVILMDAIPLTAFYILSICVEALYQLDKKASTATLDDAQEPGSSRLVTQPLLSCFNHSMSKIQAMLECQISVCI